MEWLNDLSLTGGILVFIGAISFVAFGQNNKWIFSIGLLFFIAGIFSISTGIIISDLERDGSNDINFSNNEEVETLQKKIIRQEEQIQSLNNAINYIPILFSAVLALIGAGAGFISFKYVSEKEHRINNRIKNLEDDLYYKNNANQIDQKENFINTLNALSGIELQQSRYLDSAFFTSFIIEEIIELYNLHNKIGKDVHNLNSEFVEYLDLIKDDLNKITTEKSILKIANPHDIRTLNKIENTLKMCYKDFPKYQFKIDEILNIIRKFQ